MKSVLIYFVYILAHYSLKTQFSVIRKVVERSKKSIHTEDFWSVDCRKISNKVLNHWNNTRKVEKIGLDINYPVARFQFAIEHNQGKHMSTDEDTILNSHYSKLRNGVHREENKIEISDLCNMTSGHTHCCTSLM